MVAFLNARDTILIYIGHELALGLYAHPEFLQNYSCCHRAEALVNKAKSLRNDLVPFTFFAILAKRHSQHGTLTRFKLTSVPRHVVNIQYIQVDQTMPRP